MGYFVGQGKQLKDPKPADSCASWACCHVLPWQYHTVPNRQVCVCVCESPQLVAPMKCAAAIYGLLHAQSLFLLHKAQDALWALPC